MKSIPNADLLVDLRSAVKIMTSSDWGLDNVYGLKMARMLTPIIERLECEEANKVIKNEIEYIFSTVNGAIMKGDVPIFMGADNEVLERINHYLYKK